MKKSVVIMVSMLFSIAVPTLAESTAGYTQQDAGTATRNSASRAHSTLQGQQTVKDAGNQIPALDEKE